MSDNCRMITVTVALCSLSGGMLVCGCSHATRETGSEAMSTPSAKVLNDPNVSEGQRQAMLRTIPPPMRNKPGTQP